MKFGLVARGDDLELDAAVSALTAWIAAHAGIELVREHAASYGALAESIASHALDLAWLPPIVFAHVEKQGVATAILTSRRGTDHTFQSVLVVRAEGPIKTLEDLRGKRAAWVDPWSAAGYVLPSSHLSSHGLDPRTLFSDEHFYGSHGEAVRAVAGDKADVAGTFGGNDVGDLLVQSGETLLPLRVLATFGAIPADVIAVHTSMAEEDRAKIGRAFADACAHPSMKGLIRQVFGVDNFLVGSAASYAGLHRTMTGAVADGLLNAVDAERK